MNICHVLETCSWCLMLWVALVICSLGRGGLVAWSTGVCLSVCLPLCLSICPGRTFIGSKSFRSYLAANLSSSCRERRLQLFSYVWDRKRGMHFGAFHVRIERNLNQYQLWCSGGLTSLVLIWRTPECPQQGVASTSQVLHTRNTYFDKRKAKKKKNGRLWGLCLQFNCSATLLCVSPFWPLSCIHHQNCWLCIHVKAIDPSSLFIPPLINICPGQCLWTRGWNQETRPFDVFELPAWRSQEKYANWRLLSHIGYLRWREAPWVIRSSLSSL